MLRVACSYAPFGQPVRPVRRERREQVPLINGVRANVKGRLPLDKSSPCLVQVKECREESPFCFAFIGVVSVDHAIINRHVII